MAEQQQTLTVQQTLDLAVQHHTSGRLPQAESLYQQILQSNPNQPVALHLLGVVAHQVGKNDKAVDLITKALALKPDLAEAHNNLGNALRELGKLENSLASHHKALGIKPDYADPHYNLGVTLQKLGKLDNALASHQRALDIRPDYVEAHFEVGNLFQELGNLDDAANSYRRALAIKPDFVEAHNNLGTTLLGVGKLDDAAASYRKALGLKPDLVEAHNNLGNVLNDLGKLEEAVASYHKALGLKPEYTEAHYNLGNSLWGLGKVEEAVASYLKALALKPDFADAHYNLGNALQNLGKVDEAVTQIDLALSHKPEQDGWRIVKALLLPVIPSSQEDILTRRDTLAKSVKDLSNQNLIVSDPVHDVEITNFYLAYHNQNNRSLMEDIAKLYIAACPKLTYEAKHCRSKQRDRKSVLRIGFLSSYFRDHTIGKLTRGIIQHLSRDHFEVILFGPVGKQDHISKIIDRTADKVVSLCGEFERDQGRIEDEKLDILFYPDIGMSPLTYYLAFSRLAPVQVTAWGHPDTTGIPTVDYFLSSKLSEIADASDHYSEQLVTLKTVPTYYFHPDPPKNKYTASDYGLPSDVRLYVCPQTLFKFHPEFDDILGEVLRRDPKGRLILIDDNKDGNWNKLLLQRFYQSFPGVADNVIFIPRMAHEKFLGLLVIADALLDIPSFSGGNSSLEALSVGAPIVTWPQRFMRGRVTAAFYKQMGLSDLIATDRDSYLRLALQLAQDPEFKRRMHDDIEINVHKLYERGDTVREMETFFISAYEAWQTGETIANVTS